MTLAAWQAYDTYRESGIDWIGHIPEHWEVRRSKYVFTQRKELARKNDIQLSATQSYGVILQDDFEKLVGRRVVKIQTNLEKRKHVEIDDFVISMRSFQGGLERAFATGCIRSSYVILQPLEQINADFFGYLFKSQRYIKALQATGSFIRDGQDLSFDHFSKVDLFLPPLNEQAKIAALIKAGCEKIDNGIAIKEKQIALLREMRQILIQETVTRGLNPSVPIKESGIDWIGQIPAHWEVRRSKYVFTQRKELARKDDIQLSATQSYGVISQDEFEELVGRRVVKIQTNLEKRKHVEIDDFVISMRSFQGGLERAFAKGCIRSSYVILQPLKPVNANFFGYLFKSPRYIKALQATGSFIRDGQDLNFENFSKVDLFLPPLDEQAEIAAHIKAGCEKIENAITIKEEQIAALKEYKTSLVNAAVTGKIKVT